MPRSMPLSAMPWHEVVGAWLTATDVLLVVRHDPDPDTAHVLKMNGPSFAAGALTPPLITGGGGYANTLPSHDEIEWRTLGYTNEGFAAFRWSSYQYYRFNEFGMEVGTPLDAPEQMWPGNDQKHLYGRESGWYIFDMNKLTIERRAWWWK